MNTITFPLALSMRGDAVADLQDALFFLVDRGVLVIDPTARDKLVGGLKRERDQQVFGDNGTLQLVRLFQVQQSLSGLGQVDEPTAVALNYLLKKGGAFDVQPPPVPTGDYVIRGQVLDAAHAPVAGVAVRAFERDMRKLQSLGDEAKTDDKGLYMFRYTAESFATGDVPGAMAPKLVVRAFLGDVQIGDDVSRPNATRDEVVDFNLSSPALSEWETISAAIIPLLEGQGEGDQMLPPWELNDSDLAFVAAETVLDPDRIRLWSRAFVAGRNASLVNGVAAEAVVTSVFVHALPGTVASPLLASLSIFYGWFRAGLSAESNALWATSTDTLLATLKDAIDQHIVPANVATELDGIRACIERIKLDLALQKPAPGMTASLTELLATASTPLEPDHQRAIAAALPAWRLDDPQLVKRIAVIPGLDGVAVDVARTFRLGGLTEGNIPLTRALQSTLQVAGENEGSLRPLATLRPAEWLDLTYTHGVPAGSALTPVTYARDLAAKVERQFPTDALNAHFAAGRRLSQQPALREVRTFLANNPGFDLVAANLSSPATVGAQGGTLSTSLVGGLRTLQRMQVLEASWEETATLLENGVDSPHHLLAAGATELASRLEGQISEERVAELHAEAENLYATTLAGFTAALSAFNAPAVMQGGIRFSGREQDQDAATAAGANSPGSDRKSASAFELQSAPLLSSGLSMVPRARDVAAEDVPIVSDDHRLPSEITAAIASQPALQSLFGSQDDCACEHCNSVLSPAAYYVDVLEFIRNVRMLGYDRSGQGLLARRPDLQDIELSCANTNTEVPAIDLALEILENAVALPIDVPLAAGSDVESQLAGNVGSDVRNALERTVRGALSGELRSEKVAAHADGSSDWGVVDRHRRWMLTAQGRGLQAISEAGGKKSLDLAGLDLAVWIGALDQGSVAVGGEGAFARLFTPGYLTPPDLGNYTTTVTPQTGPGGQSQSWVVGYRSVAQLRMDNQSRLLLQTPAGAVWWSLVCGQPMLLAVSMELADGNIPDFVLSELSSRFGAGYTYSLWLTGTNVWTLTSAPLELTLRFTPASLKIVSLTYQSSDTRADAIAWPENHNPAAYVRLTGNVAQSVSTPVFPWSLPLDLPLEEVRLFVERAQCSRRRLLELFLPLGKLEGEDAVLAREVLGLNQAEAILIAQSGMSANEIYACWGMLPGQISIWDAASGTSLSATSPLGLLRTVSILLQQSRLDFAGLQAVLATRFVSAVAGGPLEITPADTCNPGKMHINALTPTHLDRIHRFVRLQRRLGWSTKDLDAALLISTGSGLTEASLFLLADVVRLRELLQVPLSSILAWWAVPAPASIFARGDELARCLGLARAEFNHALALFGLTELVAFATPAAVVDFCRRVTAMRRGGIPFESLRYLLQHTEAKTTDVDLNEQQVTRLSELVNATVQSVQEAPGAQASGEESAASRLVCEGAVIAALAPALDAAPELVDALLRNRLRDPRDPNRPAIDVLAGGLLFGLPDIREIEGMVRGLRANATPVVAYVRTRFSQRQWDVLANPSATISDLGNTLVSALNELVEGAGMLADLQGAGAKLADDTLALGNSNPAGLELVRLNRQLLEEAFPADLYPARATMRAVLVHLHKAAFLCEALKLGTAGLRLLRQPWAGSDTNGYTALDFNSLPDAATARPAAVSRLEQLMALIQLGELASRAPDFLLRYASLDFAVPDADRAARQVIAEGLGVEPHEVEAAATQLMAGATAEKYRDPVALARLIDLLGGLQRIGATMEQGKALAGAAPDDSVAITARELLRNKYSASSWHELAKPIADLLRERQRDGLVDFLVAQHGLRGADDLYEYYLIDVSTSSGLNTTRLLQATASAQLYVQRLLLNLEGTESVAAEKREFWGWMDRYRVWEANRKVFLFPENWLLPELRDDKTATFRQMEGMLTEGEPSPEITRAALLDYVEQLSDLAQISVIAMYQEAATLHAVGRTPNPPYRYFSRSCEDFGGAGMQWGGWEALDVDSSGDCVMPFVFEGDLHVAWPVIRSTKTAGKLSWEVQIAWIRRTNKGWLKRKLGQSRLVPARLLNKDEAASFSFRVNKAVDSLAYVDGSGQPLKREKITVHCYAANEVVPEITPHTTMVPDPFLLKDTSPVGSHLNRDDQWNASLEVTGRLFEYATVDEEGNRFCRPLVGKPVKLSYSQRWSTGGAPTGDIHVVGPKILTTGPGGNFSFVVSTPLYDATPPNPPLTRNGSEGVFTGAPITLTLSPSSVPADEINLTRNLGGPATGEFRRWQWTINVGVENEAVKQSFLPDRAVNFREAGSFVFETGRDVRTEAATLVSLPDPIPSLEVRLPDTVPMTIDGNRFFTQKPYVWVDNIKFAGEGYYPPVPQRGIEVPAFVNRASQPSFPGYVELPSAWYLQANDGSAYLQKQANGWRRWPDGQPLASTYRVIAASSTSALFQPGVEAQVHVDNLANNFLRQYPYANYNWELFLHVPLAIADHLASQQRFEDARRWLHAVFDPTAEQDANSSPACWRFLPFLLGKQPASIAKMLTWLANPAAVDPEMSAQEAAEEANGLGIASQIVAWTKNPFMPHLIARLRPSAYQWQAFFSYLDVLLNWGDQLFRRDTRESVNEATLLYVLAAKLLGPRPRKIPAPKPPVELTYRTLPKGRAGNLIGFSDPWVTYADLPGVKKDHARSRAAARKRDEKTAAADAPRERPASGMQSLASLSALAFCIPQNEKIAEFHDRVEDRLFKVRHCQNIDGTTRDLPLFDPPIDPLLLIRAKAAGLDVGTVLAGSFVSPLPHYRFTFTLQKAIELTGEVRSLGSALLAAMEKQDAEGLTLLRSQHEVGMLKLARATREQQVAEAEANIAALQQSQATVRTRFGQYQKLLGKTGVTNGQDGLPVVEQSSSLSLANDVAGATGLGLSRREVDQLVSTAVGHQYTQAANQVHLLAGVLSIIPNIWSGDALIAGQTFGGANLGSAASAIAKAIEMGAVDANYLANQAGVFGGYERRQDEWVHQSTLALAEMKQIEKQILAAQIRLEMAGLELKNHDAQIENAESVDEFMRGKFTSQQLYRWMSSQVAEVYFRTYQLALDQAKRTERAYRYELGLNDDTLPFVQPAYWDSLKKGLMAGEHLHHDLKRMEVAYLEKNRREYEITKHVSLVQLDPIALILLKETGKCSLALPEALFDLDYPGHYLRRLKTVSLSIPCVVGPYASISCTLTLKRSAVRYKATLGTTYAQANPYDPEDTRFRSIIVQAQSIVTSSAQNDSGLFEASLRDERYLPFEGAGAIGEWEIELAGDFRAFDYNTISDVILHLRYTARDGSGVLKAPAADALKGALNELVDGKQRLARVFSLRHEFSSEWYRFLNPLAGTTGDAALVLELAQDRFPYLFQGRKLAFKSFEILVSVKPEFATTYTDKTIKLTLDEETEPSGQPLDLKPWTKAESRLLQGEKSVTGAPGVWTLRGWRAAASTAPHLPLDPSAIEDLLLVCRYTCT